MKYKVGQKVRIKQWVGVPEGLYSKWGTNEHVGCVGVVVREDRTAMGYRAYNVKTKEKKYDFFCFEEELESVIKVGEQLLFDFAKE